MADTAIVNPFVTEQSKQVAQSGVSADVAAQRELAEVQASVLMARRFPRDPVQAMDAILRACTRVTLAQGALYSYVRGGTDVTGPSIRLAEAMAQTWGNLTFGIRELEQRAGESTMESYCWDLETNVRQSRIFQVRHERYTRQGSHKLTDPRDIYEQNTNQGARRLRACILGVIPGDVVEAAVAQCEETLKAEADTSPEGIRKMVESFAALKITKEMLEARIQRRLEAIRPAQVVQLRKIWSSLNDGMSTAADWFEVVPQQTSAPQQTGNEALRARLRRDEPAPPIPHPVHEAPDRSPAVQSDQPAESLPGSAPSDPGEGDSGERSRRDAVSSPTTPSESASPADDDPMKVVKPMHRRAGRGWDWKRYAEEIVAAGLKLEPGQIAEFRAKNLQMLDVLQNSDKELWAWVQQALAEHEHSAAGEG